MNMTIDIKRFGGPYDRGSADRFYGREFNPHYYITPQKTSLSAIRITEDYMTEDEVLQYKLGWDEEIDKKEY